MKAASKGGQLCSSGGLQNLKTWKKNMHKAIYRFGVELTHQPYTTEDHLQSFLERYPPLPTGGQVDAAAPRRWLLIAREMPIPDREAGSGR